MTTTSVARAVLERAETKAAPAPAAPPDAKPAAAAPPAPAAPPDAKPAPAKPSGPAPPDIAKVAKPAPGASPVGAFAYLEGDDGTQAWLVKDGGKTVGYLRDASQPTRAIEIDDAEAWAKIVDRLGLTEQAVPTEDTATAPPAPDAAATPPAPPAATQGGDLLQGADQNAPPPPVPPQRQPPPQQGKAAPTGHVVTPSDYEEQTGIAVVLAVPEGDAQDLALGVDTAEDPTDLHLTLAFLGTTDAVDDEGAFYANALEALRDVAAEYEPLSGQISGVGRFSVDGGEDALVYLFDAPNLPELRQDIVEALEEQGVTVSREHGFNPHITIAYLKQGEDTPIRRAETKVLTFDALTFCYGDQRLALQLGGTSPDEADSEYNIDATGGYGMPDSTAPSAMVDRHQGKAIPPQFRKGGKKKGPPIASGSFVSWGSSKGRVDLVVTNGKVPGVEEDVTGSASNPAARVVVWEQGAGGKWKATGRKVGVAASSLKRTLPLTFGGKKSLGPDADEALVEVLTDYYEAAQTEAKGLPLVDPGAVRSVYERGLDSWPGEDADVPREHWALGRTKAFLTVAAGRAVPGYEADRDLLPEGHELAVKTAGMLTVANGTPETKVALTIAEGTTLDADTIQSVIAGLREAAGTAR